MNPFIQQLVDDLKAFSVELLAPGLHNPQQVPAGLVTVSNTASLLKSIEFLTTLLPKLVDELQTTEASRTVMSHYTSVPKRASLSRRPSDYQEDAQRNLLPARWLTTLPVAEIDIRPLRWLLYLLELQQSALGNLRTRTTKYIDNSLLTQQGSSSYAQSDRATLLDMRARLEEAQTRLEHARLELMRNVHARFSASQSIPHPYPRSPAWTHLRLYAQQLLNPTEYLPSFLHNLLYRTLEIADTPYLYQRWCGVKLLNTLETLGWICYDDPVGALFLGGEIRLNKQDVQISVWVEPRFSKRKPHPSGFFCPAVAETHPDYFIVTPGPHGIDDAFILDPTTSAASDVRHGKGKYLDTIESFEMLTVAGVPVVRNPLRAWSAAPIHTPHCELGDIEGRTGTVPMHPLNWTPQPLSAWVRDIETYALAWGKLRV